MKISVGFRIRPVLSKTGSYLQTEIARKIWNKIAFLHPQTHVCINEAA